MMKLPRIAYNAFDTAEFFENGLGALGALCERTWHDRLQVVAEGESSRLWNSDGKLHDAELTFAAPGASSIRDAAKEVFPGCPLLFRLSEALQQKPLALERAALQDESRNRAPDPAVAEKHWRAQFGGSDRLSFHGFKPTWHFSLVALARCEVNAIDQHWSAHRIAFALSDGQPDEHLAREFHFLAGTGSLPAGENWPEVESRNFNQHFIDALRIDLAENLERIKHRQELALRRELERIDQYFASYTEELSARRKRAGAADKTEERLKAARAEQERRRGDQVSRHEITVIPHCDYLLMAAEPAWQTQVTRQSAQGQTSSSMVYVSRAKRWFEACARSGSQPS